MSECGQSAPPLVAARPTAKPPFDTIVDNTPIAAITTLNLTQWRHWLAQGYAQEFPELAASILAGIEFGVPVEYVGDRSIARHGHNPKCLDEHAPKILAVINEDVAKLRKAGPFARMPFANLCVSPIGAVPKKNSTKVRVIHNLSFPFKGDSVNAGIAQPKERLRLSTFGHAARAIARLGPGCVLVKIDVDSAYKIVAVRREDWHLLGFVWNGKFYYERVLPFGLSSSCRLWELFATALHYILEHLPTQFGKIIIHYVDDFLFVIKFEADATVFLDRALRACTLLGVPMSPLKTEGPTTRLTFLGIELDTVAMQARLPAAKLHELVLLCGVWGEKEHASLKELQSFIGMLNFACSVVRPGRFYLRRLINHATHVEFAAHSPNQQFMLTGALRADVSWWTDFLPTFSGHSLLYDAEWTESTKMYLFTDACGTGYGGHFRVDPTSTHMWFAGAWSPEQLAAARRKEKISMPFLELHALVYAAVAWGPSWTGRKVVFMCDCLPVVQQIAKCSSKHPATMHLLRTLSQTAAL